MPRHTEAFESDGLTHSSEEVSVMEMERRIQLIYFELRKTTLGNQRRIDFSLDRHKSNLMQMRRAV